MDLRTAVATANREYQHATYRRVRVCCARCRTRLAEGRRVAEHSTEYPCPGCRAVWRVESAALAAEAARVGTGPRRDRVVWLPLR